MRTDKLELLLWGAGAFAVMAAVVVIWAVARHRPVFEHGPASAPAVVRAPDGGSGADGGR